MSNVNNSKIDFEFKFIDLIRFFKRNSKIIAIFTGLGLLFSIFYYLSSEKQYSAELKINNLYGNPQTFIRVLEISFKNDLELQKRCGFSMGGANLLNHIKFVIPKGLPLDVLNITIYRPSPELAKECVDVVAYKVKTEEISFLKDQMDLTNMSAELYKLNERLLDDINLLSNMSLKSKDYLSWRQMIRNAEDQKDKIQNELDKFVSLVRKNNFEINLSKSSVFPPKFGTFFIGLIAGFYLGLIFAIFREIFYKYK